MKVLTVKVDLETWRKLKMVAIEKNMTLQKLLQNEILNFLSKNEK